MKNSSDPRLSLRAAVQFRMKWDRERCLERTIVIMVNRSVARETKTGAATLARGEINLIVGGERGEK